MDKNRKSNKKSNFQKKLLEEKINNNNKQLNNELIFYDHPKKSNNNNNNNNKIKTKLNTAKTFTISSNLKIIKDNEDENLEIKHNNVLISNYINSSNKKKKRYSFRLYKNEKIGNKKKEKIKNLTNITLKGNNSSDNLFIFDNLEKTNKNFDEIIPINKKDNTFNYEKNNFNNNKKEKFYLTENNSLNSLINNNNNNKDNNNNETLKELKTNYFTEETDIEYLNKLNKRNYGKKNFFSNQTLTQEQFYEIDELIEKDNYRRIKEEKLKELNKNKKKNNNLDTDNKDDSYANKIVNTENTLQNSYRNNDCNICDIKLKDCILF